MGRLSIRKAMILVLFVAASAAVGGQEPAPAQRPAFEAATIKLATSAANPFPVMPAAPNRLRIQSQTLVQLIYTAYGNGGFNTEMSVKGGPDWAGRTAFFIEGVAAQKSTPQQLRNMLQTLLEDRFALNLRREMREGDALALMIDRPDGTLGPKVKPWNGTCVRGAPTETDEAVTPRCFSGYRPGGITIDGGTMISAAQLLGLPQSRRLLGGVSIDKTGLTGRYTMELDIHVSAAARRGVAVDCAQGAVGTEGRAHQGSVSNDSGGERAVPDHRLRSSGLRIGATTSRRAALPSPSFFAPAIIPAVCLSNIKPAHGVRRARPSRSSGPSSSLPSRSASLVNSRKVV